jgi:hypothetical protein
VLVFVRKTEKTGHMAQEVQMRTSRITRVIPALLVLLLVWGCVPAAKSYRAHPDFEARAQDIKAPVLVPPEVNIYELSTGGVRELRDDWSEQGQHNTASAVVAVFGEIPLPVKEANLPKKLRKELDDVQALYRAVSTSIHAHTYGQAGLFPDKVKNFEYSLGPIDSILNYYHSDALIIVYGVDEISTSGRKALRAAGLVLSTVLGDSVVPNAGVSAISVAVVDRSGTILWYNVGGSEGGNDLRDYESTESLVRSILADYPGISK